MIRTGTIRKGNTGGDGDYGRFRLNVDTMQGRISCMKATTLSGQLTFFLRRILQVCMGICTVSVLSSSHFL